MAIARPAFPATALGALLAALSGAGFAMVVFGTDILAPTQIIWLLQGDPAQHYLGFAFFRNEPWQWPPARIVSFGAPADTSLIFADALPLLALPAKLFSAGLPAEFQYFGLWQLACFALAGFFAFRVLARLGVTPLPALIGALLITTSPALLLRAYGHESLLAHWLILACFELILTRRSQWLWPLLAVAALVHAYWVAILFPIALLGWFLDRAPLSRHLVGLPLLALALWLAGYFVVEPGRLPGSGYGHFSANLLSLVDPMNWRAFMDQIGNQAIETHEWTRLLPPLGHAQTGQYEGFAYLGAGLLAVLAAALATRLVRAPAALSADHAATARRLRLLFIPATLLFLYALSTRVTFGTFVLFEIPLPAVIEKLLAVFRASGRFIWPMAYLLPLAAIATLSSRLPAPRAAALLLFCLGLQAFDLSAKWAEFHQRMATGGQAQTTRYDGGHWQSVACYPHLVVLPLIEHGEAWIPYARFAARHGQSINLAYTARSDNTVRQRAAEASLAALRTGRPQADTAYVLRESSALGESALAETGKSARVVRQDGHVIILPSGPHRCQ